jgi:hypothetical protein
MRPRARAPRLAHVADRISQRLTLEIEADAGSIAGRMSDEGGVSIEFGGWLGLAGALERFLGEDQKSLEEEPA